MSFKDRLLEKEKGHFNRLSTQGKTFFSTVVLFNLIAPIFSIFANAFLWRQSQDVIFVTLYNLTVYAFLPGGFLLNGFVLKKLSPPKGLFLGLLFQAIIVTALIFLPGVDKRGVMVFGALYGLGFGLFWANRNLISLLVVEKKENRMYYSSLEQTSYSLSSIVIPVFVGSLIVFGQTARLYTPHQGYYLISVFVLIIVTWMWFRIKRLDLGHQKVTRIFLSKNRMNRGDWDTTRLFIFLNGFFGVINFLPTLIVLKFVGKEDSLGTIQSVSAVIAVIIVYTIAKKVKNHQRISVYTAGNFLLLLAALAFAAFYSKLGVILFFVFYSLGMPLSVVGYCSIYFDSVAKESGPKQNQFAHIVDGEIFMNLGRVLSIILFILMYKYSEEAALRYILLLTGVVQVATYWVMRSIDRKHGNFALNPSLSVDSNH